MARSDLIVRRIRPEDATALEPILTQVMSSFGAADIDRPDPEVGAMFKAYAGEHSRYFVAVHDGAVVGGAGFQPVPASRGTCELRKMYLLDSARGLGGGRQLLEHCLDAARKLGYKRCYLETMPRMARACRVYEAAGFVRTNEPLGSACSRCSLYYLLDL